MTYYPDLERMEWRHISDYAYGQSIPEEFTGIMVGWLGDKVPSTGKVSQEILIKLEWAYEHRTIDQGWLGVHECEICCRHVDRGEILIINGDEMYVAPNEILAFPWPCYP